MSENIEKVEGNQVLVELAGTFDVSAAWRVHDELAKAPKNAKVTLDFTRVGEHHDIALATLVGSLAATRHRRVEYKGLCRQPFGLLRHFGAQKVATDSTVDADPGPMFATA